MSDEGELVGAGDFEAQTRQTLANLRDYGRIRAELMPDHAPAGTAVEVSALAVPGMTIEVEAIAAL